MSNSVRPHRQQPIRFPRPWDSPGKNTGVGCHFLLQCMKVKSQSEVAQVVPDSSRLHGLQPTRLLRPRGFPGKSTGVGCHCLLQFLEPIIFAIKSGGESMFPGKASRHFHYVIISLFPIQFRGKKRKTQIIPFSAF